MKPATSRHKYSDFLLESNVILLLEGKLIFSKNFKRVMDKVNDFESKDDYTEGTISDIILNCEDEDTDDQLAQNFLDIVDGKDDMISFISDKSFDKIADVTKSEYFSTRGRSEMKIGRLIRQLLKSLEPEFECTDKKIEDFVNLWKSVVSGKGEEFKLVSGKDIVKYYNKKSYLNESGTLGDSCMGHDKCSEYFDIYTKNPDQCKMVILLHPSGKILGRALVWRVDNIECSDKSFDPDWIMDRVYTSRDSDSLKFKSYARENGWAYRYYYSNYENLSFFTFHFNGKRTRARIEIKLDVGGDFDEYPYLDTFQFYNTKKTLSNSGFGPTKKQLLLKCTEGTFFVCEECEDSRFDSNGDDCSQCFGMYDNL